MAAKRTPKNAAKPPKKQPEVIELLSDSEPDVPAEKEEASEPAKEPSSSSGSVRKYTQKDYDDMPLLKVEGIKYDTEPDADNDETPASEAKPAKLPVRVKDTGSARHRHVSIEIPLMSSSLLAKGGKSHEAAPASEEEDVFKTPKERRHITFNDSDNEEFVTPLEAPLKNPLEAAQAAKEAEVGEMEEENEDSDDEAPEAISSHAAGAHLAKASQAATKAAQKQAAAQKQKRQERDAFLKQQAEKRKSLQAAAVLESEQELQAAPLFPEKRKRELPKLLPLELLESDDEDEANHSDSSAGKGASKRKKTATGWIPEAKAPRDQKVGSTVFRVVESRGDKKLGPKANKAAVNMREALLKRGKAPQVKKGFFVKSH